MPMRFSLIYFGCTEVHPYKPELCNTLLKFHESYGIGSIT